ncbi:MAG: hypothetical protein IPJ40_22260 [Saprospirales bacterium]|nr:hypothetical protein [Saprospirales bacterium]
MHREIHYVMWESRPGGAELSVNHYINGYADRRELFAYSLRPAENELYDGSKIHFQKGGAGNGNVTCSISGTAAATKRRSFTS